MRIKRKRDNVNIFLVEKEIKWIREIEFDGRVVLKFYVS